MAGYICKIVIEDTHPPVWRRIMLPDKITFEELHEIIQVLFGWSDMHLHEFEVPSDRIVIGSDEETWGRHYYERETLIDPFFRNYKWIRYTYDFGDDWRHKIIIEETDQDFKSRSAVLLKFKGDNFEEDSGGIWGAYEDARYAFEKYEVEEQLKRMVLPRHEELQETKLLKESVEELKDLLKKLMELDPMVLQSQLANVADEIHGDSPMKQKIHKWERFKEEAWDSLRLVEPVRTHKEILMDIGEKEAADYYKYLQIPREEFLLHEEEVSAIADTLREHPEYLFYIFSEKEYQELTEWIKQMPQGKSLPNPKQKNMLLKALGLGLADFACREEFGEISFASDITQLIGVVDAKTKKKEYKALAEFDDRLGKLMQVYGVIELESLYEIYKNLYGSPEDKKTFFRYVYWHARFNDFVNTAYQLDGTCYVAAKELDAYHIVESMEAYAKELPYAAYSKREIDYKGEDLANRCDWIDCLFTALRYQLNMEPYEAQEQLFRIVTVIMSGYTLNEVIEELYEEHGAKLDLETATELWTDIVGVMLELELPMLKGRSRIQYAEEQKCSAWVVGMLSDIEAGWNKTNCRMYQFPAEIQEWMYEAGAGSVERMEQLLAYKDQNQISSEEYLFLLAEACITFGQTKRVEQLIAQLKKSSPAGKKAAKHLEERLQGRYDVFDDEEDFPDSKQWSWSEPEVVQQPYVRSAPKIGRNDPCPCGSGKKYKKCCGANN